MIPSSGQFGTGNLVGNWNTLDLQSYTVQPPRTFDVEGDGDEDIFLCHYSLNSPSGAILWYENLGGGTFAPPGTIYSESFMEPGSIRLPHDYDLADAEGDGDLDIIYVCTNDDTVWVCPFADDAFGERQAWGTASGRFVRWAQLNPWDDNLPDLITQQTYNIPDIRYNIGGSFGAPVPIGPGQAGLGPDLLEVADLTSAPVEFLSYGGSRMYHYAQAGEGDEWIQTDLGELTWQPQVLDVDNDGDEDLAWTEPNTGSAYWLRSPGLYGPLQADTLYQNMLNGVFGRVDCDDLTDLFSFQPAMSATEAFICYGYDDNGTLALQAPTATGMGVNDRFRPVLADMNGDGVHDLLMVVNDTSLQWFANSAPEVLTLPLLDTLCANSSGYVLPDGQPAGGTWSGQGVVDGVFSATGLGTGDITLVYEVVDSAQCPLVGSTVIHVINSPTVTSIPETWDECTFIPLQFEGAPAGGAWTGLADSTGLVQLSPGLSGGVEYTYTDPTGGTCTAIGGIFNMGFPSEASIGYTGPYCLNAQDYQVIPVVVGNPGSFGISGWIDSVEFITPGVANLYYLADTLGLDTIIIGSSRPGFCPGVDTLVIETVAQLDVSLAAFTDTLSGTCASSYTLSGGSPAAGVYSGEGVTDGSFSPAGLVGDIAITYTYSEGGCTSSATSTIHVINGISVSPNLVEQCVSETPVPITTVPVPEVWFDPIISPEGLLNAAQSFGGIVYCSWTDVTGCQLYGSLVVDLTAFSEGLVTSTGPDPLPELICLNSAAFDITTSLGDGGEETISFDPLVEGQGDFTFIGYAEDDGSGCLRNDTLSFSVVDAPIVLVAAFTDTLLNSCEESAYPLPEGSPAGGTWTGPGVIDNVFYPFGIAGSPLLSYTVDLGDGCAASDSAAFHLISGVEILPALTALYGCIGDSPVQFTSTPAGAVWSAPATIDGYVDMLTPFNGVLSFTYTDTAGCGVSNGIDTEISTYVSGYVDIPDTAHVVCEDHPAITVSYTAPGGTLTDSIFDPAFHGPGTYYFTGFPITQPGPTQCYTIVTDSIIVLDTIGVSLDLTGVQLLSNDPVYTLSQGLPSGGTYAGDFVTGDQFDPTAAGQGWHAITYSATSMDLCSTSVTDSIYVELFTGLGNDPGTATLSVWPVPTGDGLFISLPARVDAVTLSLVDGRGQEVARRSLTNVPARSPIHWNLAAVANGSYVLLATGQGHIAPVRVVIAH